MEKKGRLATWTATVPIKITFVADERLDCEEVHEAAIKEFIKRTEDGHPESGYFDILWKKVDVFNKVVHYTREELLEKDRQWFDFIRGTRQ